MSTEIKNTLFRFVTMRAPELLENETVDINFVKHPAANPDYNGTSSSAFLDIAENLPTGKTKAKALAETAKEFEEDVLKTRERLYTGSFVSKKGYDFALWLSANRTKLTAAEIADWLDNSHTPIPIIAEQDLFELWDNLFYQIITYKSGYVRDAILSVLVADFFLRNYSNVSHKDEELRKLAQARVIIPKVLFEKEDNVIKKEAIKQAVDALPLNTKALEKELDLVLANEKIESHKVTVNELKRAQQIYIKKDQKAYALAKKTYEETIAGLYANAETTERTIIDPVTNIERTVIEYVDLVLPPFEFDKEPELVFPIEKLPEGVPPSPMSEINQIANTNGYDTYHELITHYENQIAMGTQGLFENTDLTQTMVSTNGVIFPSAGVYNPSTPNTFAVAANYSTGLIPLTLLFNGAATGMDVISADYSLTFDDETEALGTSFTDSNVNNKLSVKIFNQGVNLFERNNMLLKGIFTLSDGRRIYFEGNLMLSESPFSTGINNLIEGNTKTYLLKGKGTYDIRTIALDPEAPELPDDVDVPSGDGSVIQYIPSGYGIKRLGIADYRRVEQEVCCYVPGEVSHIENVMASEYKEKSTRRLRRSEDTTTSSSEQEIEKLTDSTSTDRFEMNQEVSSVLAQDTSMGAHASVSAEYTGVRLEAGADFANNTSSEESNSQALTHAKEVTERALDRVVKKVKEERISKIIEEFEENNKHGFDNRKNSQHVSGVYRWVDKIYRNKIINYGKRLMYEFMIPEPASFHNIATSPKTVATNMEVIKKPIDPRTGDGTVKLATHKDVLETNYAHWAAAYNVEVEPAPAVYLFTGKSFSKSQQGGDGDKWTNKAVADKIEITEGYMMEDYSMNQHGITGDFDYRIKKEPYTKYVPFSLFWDMCWVGSATLTIKTKRTPELFEKWQIETFNAIVSAYEDLLKEYEAKIAELKTDRDQKVKTNPLFYRQIENTVLRKNCIEYLASHDALGKQSLLTSGNIKETQVNYNNPYLEEYAAKVKFFEQAFEWNLMSYNFYPFYWAGKDKWEELYNVSESDDPIFRAFLQSGMARVIVTARPGFEEAVNWYMATGQVWNGGQVPTMDDPLFVSIVQELRETEGEVEETWESRVPTSLTVIQAGSIGLEVPQALPCDEDCADYKLFDSDGEPVLDENGQQISTNPFTHSNDVKLQGVDNVPDEGEQTPPIVGDGDPPVYSR